jgi:hypothetical protein
MKKTTALLAAIGVTWALAACGSSSADTPEALIERVVAAGRTGDYAKLVTLCSPATRSNGMVGVMMAKAFDPKGEMLKALYDGTNPVTSIKVVGDTATYDLVGDGENKAVRVDGRWFIDCSDEE